MPTIGAVEPTAAPVAAPVAMRVRRDTPVLTAIFEATLEVASLVALLEASLLVWLRVCFVAFSIILLPSLLSIILSAKIPLATLIPASFNPLSPDFPSIIACKKLNNPPFILIFILADFCPHCPIFSCLAY